MITTISSDFAQRMGQFCFDNRLVNREGFHDAIKTSWNKGRYGEEDNLRSRLSSCRKEISRWKRRNKTNAQEDIVILKHRLDKAHTDGSPMQHLQDLRRQLNQAYESEEEFWRLKSRKTWLSCGDRNTKYFFASAKTRAARNKLFSILDDADNEFFGDNRIGEVAQDFFTNLYRSELPFQNNHYHVLNGFQTRVTEDINADLTRPVIDDEIKQAVFSIGATKASGPDGFTGAFYHNYWEDIKTALVAEVRNFFEFGVFDKAMNHTNLCLIAKTEAARHMRDFRPIALCNVSYTIISKILVTRLKRHLSSIVSEE